MALKANGVVSREALVSEVAKAIIDRWGHDTHTLRALATLIESLARGPKAAKRNGS